MPFVYSIILNVARFFVGLRKRGRRVIVSDSSCDNTREKRTSQSNSSSPKAQSDQELQQSIYTPSQSSSTSPKSTNPRKSSSTPKTSLKLSEPTSKESPTPKEAPQDDGVYRPSTEKIVSGEDSPSQSQATINELPIESLNPRHLRQDDPERPFKCEQCGNQFAYKRSLNRHLRTIHGSGYAQCPLCSGVTFSQKVSYQKHLTSQKHLKRIWQVLRDHDSSLKRTAFMEEKSNKFSRPKLMAAWKEKGFSLTSAPPKPNHHPTAELSAGPCSTPPSSPPLNYSSSPSPSPNPYLSPAYYDSSSSSFSRESSPEPEPRPRFFESRVEPKDEPLTEPLTEPQIELQVGPQDESQVVSRTEVQIKSVKDEDMVCQEEVVVGFRLSIDRFSEPEYHLDQALGLTPRSSLAQAGPNIPPLADPLLSDSLPLPSPKPVDAKANSGYNAIPECPVCRRDGFLDIDNYVRHIQSHDSYIKDDPDYLEPVKTPYDEFIKSESLPSSNLQDPQMLPLESLFDGEIEDLETDLRLFENEFDGILDPLEVVKFGTDPRFTLTDIERADSFLCVK